MLVNMHLLGRRVQAKKVKEGLADSAMLVWYWLDYNNLPKNTIKSTDSFTGLIMANCVSQR